MSKRWFFSFFLGMVFLFLAQSGAHAQSPHYKAYGSTGAGITYVPSCFPFCGELTGGLQLQAVLECDGTPLCEKKKLQLFQTQAQLFFDNKPGDGLDRSLANGNPEAHLPYARILLRSVGFQISERWSVGLLNLSWFRNQPRMNEASNLQISLGMASVSFGQRVTSFFRGQCALGMQGPAAKWVEYASGAIPFLGISPFGFQQECQMALGSNHIQGWVGYALQSNISVGTSGAGNPQSAGSWGALLSENRLLLQAGLWIAAPTSWQQAGISGFALYAPILLQYNLNRGCLQQGDQTTPLCGNNTNGFELRLPLLFEVRWGGQVSGGALARPWNPPHAFF